MEQEEEEEEEEEELGANSPPLWSTWWDICSALMDAEAMADDITKICS